MAAAHRDFLQRVLTGFLLSKRIIVLRKLIDLKALAAEFSKLSDRLRIDTEAFAVDLLYAATGGAPWGPWSPGAHLALRPSAVIGYSAITPGLTSIRGTDMRSTAVCVALCPCMSH